MDSLLINTDPLHLSPKILREESLSNEEHPDYKSVSGRSQLESLPQAYTDDPFASLKEKLQQGAEVSSVSKHSEAKIKHDLEMQKSELIRRCQEDLLKVQKDLSEKTEYYERIISEREVQFQKIASTMQSQMKSALASQQEMWQTKEQTMVSQLQQQELDWNARIDELRNSHASFIQKLEEKHLFDKQSFDLVESSRTEARFKATTEQYEKKLKKYEKQVQDVISTYHTKELKILGALEEARRECARIQSVSDAREQTLRDELSMKDRRLIAVQSRLDSFEHACKKIEIWRTLAAELARSAIHSVASAKDLPTVPEHPEDLILGMFHGFSKETYRDSAQQKLIKDIDQYNKTKKRFVAMEKKALSKVLKRSEVSA
jgi:hypothetical protein